MESKEHQHVLRVVELKAENFKRIRAITIRPGNEPVVAVSGKNGQGKSSTIDAVWTALQGAAVLRNTPKPVRKGAEKATITLDIGPYVVTRKISRDGATSLTVTAADGTVQKSPQALLNGLLGQLTFDPLSWVRMSEKDQSAALMQMVGIDFSLLDTERQTAYDQRTAVNRDVARIKAELDAIPVTGVDLPAAPIDTATVLAEQAALIAEAKRIDGETARLNALTAKQESIVADIARVMRNVVDCKHRADEELADLEHKIAVAKSRKENTVRELNTTIETQRAVATETAAEIETLSTALESVVYPDMTAVNDQLANAGRINAVIAQRDRRRELVRRRAAVEAEAETLTRTIDGVSERRRAMVSAAKMPVPGLSIDEDSGILILDGIPLKQSSRSEQLKCAVAMAMAEHPQLRVMRIEDASILDDESMEMIRQMATHEAYQLWVEVVDKSGKVGVYIEDGEVAANNLPNQDSLPLE